MSIAESTRGKEAIVRESNDRQMIELAHEVRCLSIQLAVGEIARADYRQQLERLLAGQLEPPRMAAWVLAADPAFA